MLQMIHKLFSIEECHKERGVVSIWNSRNFLLRNKSKAAWVRKGLPVLGDMKCELSIQKYKYEAAEKYKNKAAEKYKYEAAEKCEWIFSTVPTERGDLDRKYLDRVLQCAFPFFLPRILNPDTLVHLVPQDPAAIDVLVATEMAAIVNCWKWVLHIQIHCMCKS